DNPMPTIVRVPAIWWSALALSVGLGSPAPRSSAQETSGALQRFEFTEPEMGVPFRIVLYARDAETGQAAARAAFNRVAQLNEVMSDYETDSELNELSRTSGQGRAVRVSDDLGRVLDRARQVAEQSE